MTCIESINSWKFSKGRWVDGVLMKGLSDFAQWALPGQSQLVLEHSHKKVHFQLGSPKSVYYLFSGLSLTALPLDICADD